MTEILIYGNIDSMNIVGADRQSIVRILPRGVITIPRELRDSGFGENSFVRVKKENRRLVLEPVQIIGYPVRSYTDEEVGEFFALDDRESGRLKEKGK